MLVIIFTGVNAAIQIGEQFSNRFNALIVLARRRIQCFRFFDIACFNASVKALVSVTSCVVSAMTYALYAVIAPPRLNSASLCAASAVASPLTINFLSG